MDKHAPEYDICLCKHIKRADVEKFVRENNITELTELCEKMDIGNTCGGCREDLEELINELNEPINN